MALKIRVKFHGRCEAHPRFNPEHDGLGAIKAGCMTCEQLYKIWVHAERAKGAAAYFDGARLGAREGDGHVRIDSRQAHNGITAR